MAGFLEKDQDYLDAGVEPPEHNPTQIPGDDNEAVASIINAAGEHKHVWHQKGNQIECTAGQHPHGHLVPTDQILLRTSKSGAPIFKKLDIQT